MIVAGTMIASARLRYSLSQSEPMEGLCYYVDLLDMKLILGILFTLARFFDKLSVIVVHVQMVTLAAEHHEETDRLKDYIQGGY